MKVWLACVAIVVLGSVAAVGGSVADRPGESPSGSTAASPSVPAVASRGLWLESRDLAALPTNGPAWERLAAAARRSVDAPNLADQNDVTNTLVLAKALVAARTGDARLILEVRDAVDRVIGTERGGRTLALGRKLLAYVIAADLVGLEPQQDARFRTWLRAVRDTDLDGKTLRETHEKRPNNWGTHAGASRLAIALYLGDGSDVERCAQLFRGWLGDRQAYAGFEYGDLSWQFDASHPVGIDPAGATRDGHSIDGVLPDDQRRAGRFTWPPPHENYVYEALQGALAQAVLLERAGYAEVWNWSDRALLRAYLWLHDQAQFPAVGDDRWQLPVVDRVYGTAFWDGGPTSPGKNIGWTDWTHAPPR